MIIDYSKTKKTKHKYPQEQTDETQLLRVITTNLIQANGSTRKKNSHTRKRKYQVYMVRPKLPKSRETKDSQTKSKILLPCEIGQMRKT